MIVAAQQRCCLLEVIRLGQKTEGAHQELQKPFNCQRSEDGDFQPRSDDGKNVDKNVNKNVDKNVEKNG